jgi:hypothetical protein
MARISKKILKELPVEEEKKIIDIPEVVKEFVNIVEEVSIVNGKKTTIDQYGIIRTDN